MCPTCGGQSILFGVLGHLKCLFCLRLGVEAPVIHVQFIFKLSLHDVQLLYLICNIAGFYTLHLMHMKGGRGMCLSIPNLWHVR